MSDAEMVNVKMTAAEQQAVRSKKQDKLERGDLVYYTHNDESTIGCVATIEKLFDDVLKEDRIVVTLVGVHNRNFLATELLPVNLSNAVMANAVLPALIIKAFKHARELGAENVRLGVEITAETGRCDEDFALKCKFSVAPYDLVGAECVSSDLFQSVSIASNFHKQKKATQVLQITAR